jgi:glutamyl-Q tRNA(Asp) synthetase
MHYRGRFAPTPSGPLHLGSLVTALASFLDARAHSGQWLLRIDDLDRPRVVPGAEAVILQQLQAHGLFWDERVHRQSQHLDAYRQALSLLEAKADIFGCQCTRAGLAQRLAQGPDDAVYDGLCRKLRLPGPVLRFQVPTGLIELQDRWRGPLCRNLSTEVGDFVVRRRDGQIGYQLASAVDEQLLGITQVVRGRDLIGSSIRQQLLLGALGIPPPGFAHGPLLLEADGRKLSKQNHAAPIDEQHPVDNLLRALEALAQPLPPERPGSVADTLNWAIVHWAPGLLPLADLRLGHR